MNYMYMYLLILIIGLPGDCVLTRYMFNLSFCMQPRSCYTNNYAVVTFNPSFKQILNVTRLRLEIELTFKYIK